MIGHNVKQTFTFWLSFDFIFPGAPRHAHDISMLEDSLRDWPPILKQHDQYWMLRVFGFFFGPTNKNIYTVRYVK